MSKLPSFNGFSPFFGSHVLGTSTIRLYDAERIDDEIYDEVLPDAFLPSSWTTKTIKTYMNALLNKFPKKLDSLILVNTCHFNCEIVQAAASAIPTGTPLKVIPSLMSRFLYITNNIQTPIKEDQHVLILTKVGELVDFHVLQRKNSIYNLIYEWQGYPVNIPTLFKTYASKYIKDGGIGVILYDKLNERGKDEIVRECSHINIIETLCSNWNEMLLHGGLNKATTLMSNNSKHDYDVKDFTIGFQLIINDQTGKNKTTPLIKVGTEIPVTFYKEMMLDKKVLIRSNLTTSSRETIYKRDFNLHYSKILDSGMYGIKIDIDENGFEKMLIEKKDENDLDSSTVADNIHDRVFTEETEPGNSKDLSHLDQTRHSNYLPRENSFTFEKLQSCLAADSEHNSLTSPLTHPNPITPQEVAEQQSLILPAEADFMVCLNERHCCICLPCGGNMTTRISNINGNKWIPMYVSFLNCPPSMGEEAVLHKNINPECVVYDILNMLFVPYSEIQIKQEWDFNIAYTGKREKNTVIECQTWKGPHAVEPVTILTLIFVALHKEAERVSGRKLKSVFVKTTKYKEKIDEAAIQNAVKRGRLECAGVEAMPILEV